MKLASHNSWSYGRPQRWWMRIFQPFSKCQDENIRSQYLKGVKMFDLRLKYYNEAIHSAHGIVVYSTPAQDICTLNNMLWMWEEPVYIRVLMESRNPSEKEIRYFHDYCRWLEERFPKITFFGGHGAHGKTWRQQYYTFKNSSQVPSKIIESHASVCGGIFPYWYAKRNNRAVINDTESSDVILMIDFV